MLQKDFFDALVWQNDRMLLNDLVFRLEHYKDNDTWELGDECFIFFKIKSLIDQYAKFWATREDVSPRNIFEIGLWDGGSLVFWFECFHPEKHVGIDILQREDGPYFTQYLASKGINEQIVTYWNTSQTDSEQLRKIIKVEFGGSLDLVIDDASHMYAATKTSFEILFPLLRPGGLYIIEDWAWAHWKEFQHPTHPWAKERALTDLIVELIEATGSSTDIISNMAIYQGFTVIERGTNTDIEKQNFSVNECISRRPTRHASKWTSVKHLAKRLLTTFSSNI